MTVVEVRGRGGQLLERYRSDKYTIRIGRAFDNDVVVEDRYVSPHHLTLVRTERGWRVDDLESLNGFKVRSKGRGRDPGWVASGDRLRIGHTTLRIFDGNHPVEPTLEIDGAEALLSMLGSAFVWPTVVAVTLAILALSHYRSTFTEFQPLSIMSVIVEAFVGTIAIAGFWALLGRLLRHKAGFLAQLSIWLIFTLANMGAVFVAQTIGYNASSATVETVLEHGLGFVLLTATLWSSLTLATNLRSRGRLFSAFGLGVVFLAVGLGLQAQITTGFSSTPDYYARVKHPALRFRPGAYEASLVDRVTPVFDRADEALLDDRDE